MENKKKPEIPKIPTPKEKAEIFRIPSTPRAVTDYSFSSEFSPLKEWYEQAAKEKFASMASLDPLKKMFASIDYSKVSYKTVSGTSTWSTGPGIITHSGVDPSVAGKVASTTSSKPATEGDSEMTAQLLQIDLLHNRKDRAVQLSVLRVANGQTYVINRSVDTAHRSRHFGIDARLTKPVPTMVERKFGSWKAQEFFVGSVFGVDITTDEIHEIVVKGTAPTSLTTRVRTRRNSLGDGNEFVPFRYAKQYTLEELKSDSFWQRHDPNYATPVKAPNGVPAGSKVGPVVPPAPVEVTIPALAGEDVVKAGTKITIESTGSVYLARKVEGDITDVQMLRQARKQNLAVLMRSLPGTGKTMAALAAFGDELLTIQCDADTLSADFTGGFIPTDKAGEFGWADGNLVKAMEQGRPLLVDEIALAESRALAVLLSAMDGRREIVITANPARGTIKAKEGFFVIAAYNPDVPGARMSDAILSRFPIQIQFSTDFDAMKKLGVPQEIVTAARNLDKKREAGEIATSPQAREMLNFKKNQDLFGEAFALRALIQSLPVSDQDVVADVLNRSYGKTIKALATN